MNLKEMVEKIVREDPTLAAIPVRHGLALVMAAFSRVGQAVDGTADGIVNVPRLGAFRIKQVEREVAGKKTNVKVVVFRPAPPRQEVKATTKGSKRS